MARLMSVALTEAAVDYLRDASDEIATLRQELAEARDLIAHLAGLTDLAGRYGVTKQAVANWSNRNRHFPKPVLTLSAGSLWDEREVTAWRARHRAASIQRNVESETHN